MHDGCAACATLRIVAAGSLGSARRHAALDPSAGRGQLLAQMVVGQVLFGHLLAVLRRLAEEHHSGERFGRPEG